MPLGFYEHGRGHYREVIAHLLAESPGDGPIHVGSNEQTRTVTQFGFYLNPNGTQDGGGNAPSKEHTPIQMSQRLK